MLRIILANIVFWVLACVPASADYASSRAWFEGLGDNRFDLQDGLILAGFYTGYVDGQFDPAVYKALTDFQETRRVAPDGVLEPAEIEALNEAALDTYSRLDFQRWVDERLGVEIWIPRALFTRVSTEEYGSIFTSTEGSYTLVTLFQQTRDDTLDEVYAEMTAPIPGRTLTYQGVTEHAAVITADLVNETGDSRSEYMLMFKVPGGAGGFVFAWGAEDRQTGEIAAAFMASSVWPLAPQTNPPPKPKS